ncbi:hypothetical protein K0M31_010017 [Melipona bicolor]|uniref:Uncharacterized protein n=1 Tax=Melipona bicolor TaxID=60889 RepID=A0AA40KIQ6_9HYME|nr:hypothetical protein K0M31_010017 [Melipona bicolor]
MAILGRFPIVCHSIAGFERVGGMEEDPTMAAAAVMAVTTKGKPRWVHRATKTGRPMETTGAVGTAKVIQGGACPGILIAALPLIGLHDAL